MISFIIKIYKMKRAFSENEISGFLHDIIGQNPKFNQQKIIESIYLLEIDKNLKDIIPEVLLDHIHAYKYSSGKLYIATDHGIYAQQLQLYRDKIASQLRDKVSQDIQKIEIHVGRIYSKNQKTGDIMSRNEILSNNLKMVHENADIIEQMISEIKKST